MGGRGENHCGRGRENWGLLRSIIIKGGRQAGAWGKGSGGKDSDKLSVLIKFRWGEVKKKKNVGGFLIKGVT